MKAMTVNIDDACYLDTDNLCQSNLVGAAVIGLVDLMSVVIYEYI